MFEPGQKVICIDGTFTPDQLKWLDKTPFTGVVYTVRDIVPGVEWGKAETVAVYLEEIMGVINPAGIERGWNCNRFRELETLPPKKHVNSRELQLT